MPLSRNGFITVLILAFVAIWNDYPTALVLLPDQQNRTLSVALACAKDEYRVDYGMMSAAIVFAVTPMLLLYFVLKDRITTGMAAGAVKGRRRTPDGKGSNHIDQPVSPDGRGGQPPGFRRRRDRADELSRTLRCRKGS